MRRVARRVRSVRVPDWLTRLRQRRTERAAPKHERHLGAAGAGAFRLQAARVASTRVTETGQRRTGQASHAGLQSWFEAGERVQDSNRRLRARPATS